MTHQCVSNEWNICNLGVEFSVFITHSSSGRVSLGNDDTPNITVLHTCSNISCCFETSILQELVKKVKDWPPLEARPCDVACSQFRVLDTVSCHSMSSLPDFFSDSREISIEDLIPDPIPSLRCNINLETHRNLATNTWRLVWDVVLTSCSRKSAFIVPCDQKSIAWASSFIEIVLTRRKLPTNTTFWMP